jgi:hypothetical protein
MVLVVMFVAAPLVASAPEAGAKKPTAAEEMERHKMDMERKGREADFEHEQKLRGLEIERRKVEIDRMRSELDRSVEKGGGGVLLLLILLTHIILTVWVFRDMHEQKIGRALWVPIVLLTGVFGSILYAIVRHADVQAKTGGRGAGRQGA